MCVSICDNSTDLQRLENHEPNLIVDQLPIIPIPQLGNPVSTTNQYEQDSQQQKPQEELHPLGQQAVSSPTTKIANHVVDKETYEDDQRNDLENQAHE